LHIAVQAQFLSVSYAVSFYNFLLSEDVRFLSKRRVKSKTNHFSDEDKNSALLYNGELNRARGNKKGTLHHITLH
jgi:hypothetical protein